MINAPVQSILLVLVIMVIRQIYSYSNIVINDNLIK